MNLSSDLIRTLASQHDQNAKRVYTVWMRLHQTHEVNVSWADDGIGFLISISPKQFTPDEIESRFFAAA